MFSLPITTLGAAPTFLSDESNIVLSGSERLKNSISSSAFASSSLCPNRFDWPFKSISVFSVIFESSARATSSGVINNAFSPNERASVWIFAIVISAVGLPTKYCFVML